MFAEQTDLIPGLLIFRNVDIKERNLSVQCSKRGEGVGSSRAALGPGCNKQVMKGTKFKE